MTTRQRAVRLTSALIFSGTLLCSAYASAHEMDEHSDDGDRGRFSFGLWGDMPYAKSGDQPKIPALIADINAARIAFSIYDGDTKDGSSVCDDETISTKAADMFNSLRAPLVYVPGDNEWTDCHRTNNGGYNALERLTFLRQNMFNSATSFGQKKMVLNRQGEPGRPFSENTRWMYKGIVFVGMNVPGSNNNKVNDGACASSKSARTQADCDADNAEYADRNAHNLIWLHDAFEMAKAKKAKGVMVVIQGDPWFDLPETEDINERADAAVNGYTDFLNAIVEETNSYSGQVVLVHGDTHFFKVDKPLVDQAHLVKNFTRVETFGSPNIHWIKVTVDPTNPNVFDFEPMIVPGN